MIRAFTFCAVASTLCACAVQAPYQKGGSDALEGDYIVHFYQGHSLDKHYAHIGKILGDAEGLRIHDWLPGYRAALDDETVHRLVRSDPGVSLVENNSIMSKPKPPGGSKGERRTEESNAGEG